MAFSNPIIGGEDTLIRNAIRSPDYVPGVSGWSINKDGTAEFNDVTIRGSVEAANGTIVLDDDGLYINTPGGYIYIDETAISFNDDDGSYVDISAGGGLNSSVALHPAYVAGKSYASGYLFATTFPAQNDAPVIAVSSPYLLSPTRPYSRIYLIGQDGAGNAPMIDLRATGPVRIMDGDLQAKKNVVVDGDLSVAGVGSVEYRVLGSVSTAVTTGVSVPNGVLNVLPGERYWVELYLAYDAPVATDAKVWWSGVIPAGVDGGRYISAPALSNATNIDTNMMAIRRGLNTQQPIGGNAGVANAFTVYKEMLWVDNQSTFLVVLDLQWAANAAGTALCQGGHALIRRV